ncbi:MAG: hypothetical protein ABI430_04730 [Candidatus Taylorbacteria bacterium]
MDTSKSDTVLSDEVRAFPCKCDHCLWTGTVGDAVIIDGKAQCPKCKGSLAANRTEDKIKDGLHELLNLEDTDF